MASHTYKILELNIYSIFNNPTVVDSSDALMCATKKPSYLFLFLLTDFSSQVWSSGISSFPGNDILMIFSIQLKINLWLWLPSFDALIPDLVGAAWLENGWMPLQQNRIIRNRVKKIRCPWETAPPHFTLSYPLALAICTNASLLRWQKYKYDSYDRS